MISVKYNKNNIFFWQYVLIILLGHLPSTPDTEHWTHSFYSSRRKHRYGIEWFKVFLPHSEVEVVFNDDGGYDDGDDYDFT